MGAMAVCSLVVGWSGRQDDDARCFGKAVSLSRRAKAKVVISEEYLAHHFWQLTISDGDEYCCIVMVHWLLTDYAVWC